MNPDEIQNLLQVTKTDFILDGLITFFALMVVILLIQGQEFVSSDSRHAGMRQGAFLIFTSALFAGILAFFLFVISVSENYHSQRAFTLTLAADFLFAISGLFVVYGMALMTRVFAFHSFIVRLTDNILYIAMMMALLRYALTTKDVISVMYQKTSSEILTQAGVSVPVINAFLFCPILAIVKRILDRHDKVRIPSGGFTAFIVISIILFIIVSLMPTLIIRLSPGAFLPLWLILLFVILFSSLIAGMILFIPAKEKYSGVQK